jgi:hypothetical protein
MWESIVFTLALLFSVWFVNYKYSTAVRVIVFHEVEDGFGALCSFFSMVLAVVMWGIYYYITTK